MTTRLEDHRRFQRAVMAGIAAMALTLGGVLAITGHGRSLSGLCAGALIAEVDALLLGRSLSRFAARSDLIGARALTVMMMSRFLMVSAMVGVVVCAQGIDPLGVVAGVMLFPVAITVVGITAVRGAGAPGTVRR